MRSKHVTHQWVLPSVIVGKVGLEPTCNQLSFQLLIRQREYIPICALGWIQTNDPSLNRRALYH